MSLRILLTPLAALFAAACATVPQQAAEPVRPGFVIAANPLAAKAGMDVIQRGGSAADAAVAVQAALSLVEPQSSGLGGGAFMTYFDARTGKVIVYDGRETAPAGASPTMFIGTDGKPLPFATAVLSGRATGVPGALRMLETVQRAHGRLRWSELFEGTAVLAEQGFTISPRLGRMLGGDYPQLTAPDVVKYFSKPDGTRLKVGDRLSNPVYARFLRRLASGGADVLYKGETAARIVERVRQGPFESSMTMADLARYRPVRRDALCREWQAYTACVPPPPSSGVSTLQLLAMLGRTDIAARGPSDPQAWYLFAEASRLMYADRDRYVADPAFVTVPVDGLLDPAYVASRAALIGRSAGPPPVAGTPPGAVSVGADRTLEPAGTSHFIVGDSAGNVVSMTTTVESIFGSGRMVDGFFLNNQMTDFSFSPTEADGRPAANAVAGGKRPRSSMTPLILLDGQGRFAGAFGSPGGSAILAYVGKTMTGALLWKLPVQEAIDLPNLVARGNGFGGEVDKFPAGVVAGLAARGVALKPGQGEDSGVHAVMVRPDGSIDGGFDRRREGVVLIDQARTPVRR
ncbi:gamma-glutamyltranspeptidase/glutathione hydrolase [Sphingomonas kaistensis]|uniref:Gamma-glutamyltranspeptidase/glutathione hydrolase n=1 Tax=Sphingomonas kaistensis TaxID=298708 RepID=A0A7X5Y5G9_9SPHN|nr:gamma-glutamyltransferase family protein [Sphingomonas kaistensis]NJC04937.1 gamma-glutamyltranspeptidase/glutathione hydrolase [Sphingomonas kaistensis]